MLDKSGAQISSDASGGEQALHRKPLMERLHAEYPITDAEAADLHQRTLVRLNARRAEILKDALTPQDLAEKSHLPWQTYVDRFNAVKMLAVQDSDMHGRARTASAGIVRLKKRFTGGKQMRPLCKGHQKNPAKAGRAER